MTDTNVIKLAQPGTFTDSLTEILRDGARALLTQAVEREVADFLGRYAELKTEAGHQRVVRHGHLPEREIMTGIGPGAVRQPRVRDREATGGERIRFPPPPGTRSRGPSIPEDGQQLWLANLQAPTGSHPSSTSAMSGRSSQIGFRLNPLHHTVGLNTYAQPSLTPCAGLAGPSVRQNAAIAIS